MSSENKAFPLAEENSPRFEVKNDSQQNNIIIKSSKKKSEEDYKSMNSAECSEHELKDNKNSELHNIIKQANYSMKTYEKITEKLKEKTMRLEVEKIYHETERLKNKYEEMNAHLHCFDNNPQFQNMLKMVGKQLRYFFIEGIILIIFSGLLYFFSKILINIFSNFLFPTITCAYLIISSNIKHSSTISH